MADCGARLSGGVERAHGPPSPPLPNCAVSRADEKFRSEIGDTLIARQHDERMGGFVPDLEIRFAFDEPNRPLTVARAQNGVGVEFDGRAIRQRHRLMLADSSWRRFAGAERTNRNNRRAPEPSPRRIRQQSSNTHCAPRPRVRTAPAPHAATRPDDPRFSDRLKPQMGNLMRGRFTQPRFKPRLILLAPVRAIAARRDPVGSPRFDFHWIAAHGLLRVPAVEQPSPSPPPVTDDQVPGLIQHGLLTAGAPMGAGSQLVTGEVAH